VLRSESDSGFYIGFSTSLRARLREHQDGESFATKSRGPWKLSYYEAYTEREDHNQPRERTLLRGAGAVRHRPSRPGRIGWKRRGCSSVAKKLRADDEWATDAETGALPRHYVFA
jgi:hypothetical protein